MSDTKGSVPGTGNGTEATADAKTAARARSLANLRPPFRKGESGNPRGINGRGKACEIAAFLEQPDSDQADRTRFEYLIERLYRWALRGNVMAAKTLLEYRLGKPGIRPNPLAVAEHMRRIERDRVEVILRAVGSLNSQDLARVMELVKDGGWDNFEFLAAAEQFLEGGEIEGTNAEQAATDEAPVLVDQVSGPPDPKGEP